MYRRDDATLARYTCDQRRNFANNGCKLWLPKVVHACVRSDLHLLAESPSFDEVMVLERLRVAAMRFIDEQEIAHHTLPGVMSQLDPERFGIRLRSVPLNMIDEKDRRCGICLENMMDTEISHSDVFGIAQYETEISQIKRTFISCPIGEEDPWAMKLKTHLLRTPDRWDEMVRLELEPFIYSLICAQERWAEISQSLEGCIGPVALSCNHIFGLCCIAQWLVRTPPLLLPVQSCLRCLKIK